MQFLNIVIAGFIFLCLSERLYLWEIYNLHYLLRQFQFLFYLLSKSTYFLPLLTSAK